MIVAVIWLAGLIAAIVTGFTVKVRVDTLTATNVIRNTQAELIADGMTRLTAFRIAVKPPEAINGEPVACLWRRGVVAEVRVQDHAGLIDLNAMPAPFLEELFTRLGGPSPRNLTQALEDFRDIDATSAGGPEPNPYPQREFGPKNAPFQAIEELDQLPGMNDELYRALLPLVTVYGGQQNLDPASTPPQMRKLFGEKPKGAFTGFLQNYSGASGGKVFGIDVRVTADAGARFRRRAIAVVLRQPDKPFVFLEWQRGQDWDDGAAQPSEPCFNRP